MIKGSISESGLFSHILLNQEIKNRPVSEVMEKPYPLVDFNTPVERLTTFITKENGAILTRDESGSYHIITKYDIIQSLSKS